MAAYMGNWKYIKRAASARATELNHLECHRRDLG